MSKKLYQLEIGHQKIFGTKAKCEAIQRALIGTETIKNKYLFAAGHPAFDDDFRSHLVHSDPISTTLKVISDPILTEDEFAVLRKAAEEDWEIQNQPETLALPEPRKELPEPRKELPAPRLELPIIEV